jgi:hypothetical protein
MLDVFVLYAVSIKDLEKGCIRKKELLEMIPMHTDVERNESIKLHCIVFRVFARY